MQTSVQLRNAIKGVACTQTSIPLKKGICLQKLCKLARVYRSQRYSSTSGLIVMSKWPKIVVRARNKELEDFAKAEPKTESQSVATTPGSLW